MDARFTPVKLDLKKDEQLEIQWADGHRCVYSIGYLRTKCPCAQCRQFKVEQEQKKSLLTVLPGNYSGALTVQHAELVGNYALKLAFSDGHDSGIYSFQHLREICRET